MSAYLWLTISLFVLCTVLYILRILHPQLYRHRHTLYEQAIITLAYCLTVALFTFSILIYRAVRKFEVDGTTHTKMELMKALYHYDTINQAQGIMTMLSVAVTFQSFSKITTGRVYGWLLRALLVLQCLFVVTIIPLAIPCLPAWHWWTLAEKDLRCFNLGAAKVTLSVICLLNDLLFCIIPIPVVRCLTTRLAKFAAYVLLVIGFVVVAADSLAIVLSVRFWFTSGASDFRNSQETTRYAKIFFRAFFRAYVSFVVACAPQARSTIAYWLRGRVPLQTGSQHDAIRSAEELAAGWGVVAVGLSEKLGEPHKGWNTLIIDGADSPSRASQTSGLDMFGPTRDFEIYHVDDRLSWLKHDPVVLCTDRTADSRGPRRISCVEKPEVPLTDHWRNTGRPETSPVTDSDEDLLAETIYTLPFMTKGLDEIATPTDPQDCEEVMQAKSPLGHIGRKPSDTLPSAGYDRATTEIDAFHAVLQGEIEPQARGNQGTKGSSES